MAAISPELFESELFGHVRGSFSGATQDRPGYFELANRGTLFLDEIGDLRPDHQGKLLRALQERTFYRVGATKLSTVDVRIIAATNRDLTQGVTDGWFRPDLYARLRGLIVTLPPLRDRREDIPLLVAHFIKKLSQEVGRPVRGVTPEALGVLEQYHWPGNIRELENVVERAIVLGSSELLEPSALPANLRRPQDRHDVPLELPAEGIDLEATLDRIEHRYMQLALERVGGVQTHAAELLRVSFRQFRYKLQKFHQRRDEESK
jgi:transcriptional regulator with PAS, ATPase and Fis domain